MNGIKNLMYLTLAGIFLGPTLCEKRITPVIIPGSKEALERQADSLEFELALVSQEINGLGIKLGKSEISITDYENSINERLKKYDKLCSRLDRLYEKLGSRE